MLKKTLALIVISLTCSMTFIGCGDGGNSKGTEAKKVTINFEKETPKGEHQPFMHGYNSRNIKDWTPEKDVYSKYFRSRVGLSNRIEPFKDTQANPKLTYQAKVMNLSADYDKEAFFEAYRYNDAYCRNLLNFWQYTDYYASWHGLPVDGSSTSNPDFGVINLPNPAYTDAAHKNGVKSLGCWFWPRKEKFSDWVEKKPDGTFPVADKMIEMANYFGFDGYFINQEADISEQDSKNLMEMIKYMRKKAPDGFHLQWYDSLAKNGMINYVNGFNEENSPWIIDNGTPVNNSMFMNYAWNTSRLVGANIYAKKLGLNPYETLFAGTENDKYNYEPPFDPIQIFPDGKEPRSSWGLFGTDFVWNKYNNKFDPNAQEEVFKRERVYWSGPKENPTKTGRNEKYKVWDGVAHFIPERSVIGKYPFVTTFNTGHGRAYFVDGELCSSKEWCNAGIQDILPSWQWWTECNGKPLSVKFDYTNAYNGGSSLNISGNLNSDNTTNLRLYKTKLPVSSATNLSVTYNLGKSNKKTNMKVMLIFEDNPSKPEYIEVGKSQNENWNKVSLDLSKYAGKTIATVGLRFEGTKEQYYSINLGEIAITDSKPSEPKIPTGFEIENVYYGKDTAEVYLKWNLDSSEETNYYEIYRVKPDGKKEFLGKIYDDVYYVKNLKRISKETSSALELVSVGKDGQKSKITSLQLNWK